MTPGRRANLQRLLKPRHVALIGGADAVTVAGECARIGFEGPVWPVNPRREEIGGHPCFRSLEDLPEPPDAAFLAVPREPAIAALDQLRSMGAGGVVCYTAGFRETGEEGAAAEARLIESAGELALVGPNCYGVINYVDRVALWPFAHGGSCPGYGAAIVTQSGMMASDLSMTQRSVPFAYMISAGNQSVLRLEDYVDVLSERAEVRAIGLHIEGLQDVLAFEAACRKALERKVPIVAFKTGTSRLGAEATVSHTGSLSGDDDLYDALFDRLGIIRVHDPVQLLETLKLLCVAGAAAGPRVGALTCSGGSAAMLADHGAPIGVEFPRPTATTTAALRELLPFTATVSNPLDYTTPIWGRPDRTRPAFRSFFADDYDAALIVQDYPPAGLDESRPSYLSDADSFIEAVADKAIPPIVCSSLPENFDEETRAYLVSRGVAPMQGLQNCLNALAGSAWYSKRRAQLLGRASMSLVPGGRDADGATGLLDEAAAKSWLRQAGLAVPKGVVVSGDEAADAARSLRFPVALKMVSARLPHKTEAGAVRLGLESAEALADAVTRMHRDVTRYDAEAVSDRFLIEEMADAPVAELLVSVRREPQFGLAMTLASGGVLVELLRDAVTLLLPATRDDLAAALAKLRSAPLLDGYRGKPGADKQALIDALQRLSEQLCFAGDDVAEVEINPLFVQRDGVCAVDVLLRRYRGAA